MKLKTILVIVFCLGAAASIPPLAGAEKGVVVEDVKPFSTGEKAGVAAGDILRSWERSSSLTGRPGTVKGTLTSVFDFMTVETEQGPRGPVRFSGERNGRKIILEIPVGEWKVTVRPPMSEAALKTYLDGRALVDKKELEKGTALWGRVAASKEGTKDGLFSCWLHLQIGSVWADQRKWAEAQGAYDQALAEAEKVNAPWAQTAVRNAVARMHYRQNNLKKAAETYEAVITIWEGRKDGDLHLALGLHNAGTMAYFLGELDKAEGYHTRALGIREKLAPVSADTAMSLNNLGLVINRRGDLKKAKDFYGRALAIWEKLPVMGLPAALTVNNLSIAAYQEGRIDDAIRFQERTLAIREMISPGGVDVAASLNNLGVFMEKRGDLEKAEELHQRALGLKEKLAPGSLDVAYSLTNLASLAEARGDFVRSEELHKHALAIRQKAAPDSLEMTASLNNLGVVAGRRGFLELSESYHRRALAIREKKAPTSFETASSLTNLGVVSRLRGELDLAESCHKRALAIFEKTIPDSFHVAGLLSNLGSVYQDKGDLAAAVSFYERALALREKLVPGSFDMAESLNNLGIALGEQGDLDKAEEYHKRALALREKLAAGGVESATSLVNLGRLAADRGDSAAAAVHFLNALAIWEKALPGSASQANVLHELGVLYRKGGDLQKAEDFLNRSLNALETQISRLGGSQETKAGFRAKYGRYYQDYIDVLMKLKKHGESFHFLERSRAQLFLAMLAERDLFFSADLPPELEKSRKQNAWEYDQIQRKVAGLDPVKDKEESEKLSARMQELQSRQAAISAEIRKASPRYASLQYPVPLDVPAARTLLDPGTALLSYSLGDEGGHLFVLTPEHGLSVLGLSLAEKGLRQDVERFRVLIQRGRTEPSVPEALVALGKRLYDALIQPAEPLLKKSRRLLIVPDGPLHILPFGALVRSRQGVFQASRKNWQYLVEWKPVHLAVSATVYGELQKQRPGRGGQEEKTLWAFGDPKYPAGEGGQAPDFNDAAVRSLVAVRGYGFTPLPASREEVLAIAQSFGAKATVFLGEDAMEEKAKKVGEDVDYLHFACHGLLDEKFPLNSGLALSLPAEPKEGQDNGLLQAWEIFERVRLKADMLVLSACETGLGKEMAEEGLVGLTRAFQYAGARSIVASLWQVADVTTAELMKRFYGYLDKGWNKDRALQAAQTDMMKVSPSAHPFFWAAFTLQGDWK